MDDTQNPNQQSQTNTSSNILTQQEEHTLVQFPKAQAHPVQDNVASQPTADDNTENSSNSGSTLSSPQSFSWGNDPSVPDNSLQPEPQLGGSGKNKEVGPLPSLSADLSEILQPTEATVDLDPAVEAVGVKEVNHLPKLSQDDLKAGLQPAKETIPVGATFPPIKNSVPGHMTEEEAELITKKSLAFQDSSSSMVWLAYLWTRYYALNKKDKEDKNT